MFTAAALLLANLSLAGESLPLKSVNKANEIIDAAIEAHGGAEALEGLDWRLRLLHLAAYAQLQAADLMRWKAASFFDAGKRCGAEANMAKLLASEASWAAGNACVDTHGGFGFAAEYDIERKLRETRLYQVAPISTNLILSHIATHELTHAFTAHLRLRSLRLLGFDTDDDLEAAGIRLFQLLMPVPLDPGQARDFAEGLDEVLESVCVGQEWEDDVRIVLFVRLRDGQGLDEDLQARIRKTVRDNASPRHVPAKILQVPDIPRTVSGKIVELAVRDVIHGRRVGNADALANPDALDLFRDLPELSF